MLLVVEEQLHALLSDLWLMMATPTVTLLHLDWRTTFLFFLFDLVRIASHLCFTKSPYDSHADLGVIAGLLNFQGEAWIGLRSRLKICRLPVSDPIQR
jgi:hypothetical protein